MRIYFSGEEEFVFDLVHNENGYQIKHKDGIENIFLKKVGGENFFSFDNKSWKVLVPIVSSKDSYILDKKFEKFVGFKKSGGGQSDFGSLLTQMPGKVVKILTEKGARVSKGETLLILEAMKMENEIKASIDSVVKSIEVSEGQNIETGQLMISLDTIEK